MIAELRDAARATNASELRGTQHSGPASARVRRQLGELRGVPACLAAGIPLPQVELRCVLLAPARRH